MRSFWVFSVTLAVAGGVSCSSERTTGIVVNKAFRTVIAPSAKVLASVDLKRLKSASLFQKHSAEFKSILVPDADKLGFDPADDVDYIGFTWDGERSVLFVEGRFDTKKITAKLTERGARPAKSGHYTLYGDENNAVTFLSDRAALVGTVNAIKSAIEIQEKGTGEVPEELAQRLRTIPERDQFWLVSRGGLPINQAPLRSDMQTNLNNFAGLVSAVTLGLGVDAGSRLQAALGCNSPDAATRVHDALRGIIGFARLSTKDKDADLLKIYDAVQVDKDGNIVRVHADLAPEQMERLIALVPQFRGRPPHM